MATIATRPRPDRRKLPRLTRAVAAAAITAGLALGAGALVSAPAAASEPAGTDDTVSIQAWEGPFLTWRDCNFDREMAEYLYGYDTTPCTRGTGGWYYQYF
ncbi:hypothetical protein [Glycomyces harbinensis]|uniref:Uncharacterized protein n=1 Tax=Glycomyces harbinensis TaxID=58114 RepID=A0A1G6ZN25_9ACTN|nr:hypothetical protein [Glycomyces harbinensis]SDE03783.1 hypothetical protein SAMN05216270_11194 [Glycomyces harbinensis]